jgi:hypothetical protein
MTEFLRDELRIAGSKVDGLMPDRPCHRMSRRKTSYRLVSPLNRRKFKDRRRSRARWLRLAAAP